MKRRLFIVTIASVFVFGLFMTMAVAARPSAHMPGEEEKTSDFKDGDQRVIWYGYGYRRSSRNIARRSGRLESTNNRAFRGGGLHGGK